MAFNTEVLADSPECYWQHRAASGTSESDASGNGHALTLTASGITFQQTSISGDPSDYAQLLDDASSAFGYVATPTAVKNATGLTLEWMGSIDDATITNSVLIVQQIYGNGIDAIGTGAGIYIDGSGYLRGWCCQGDSQARTVTTTLDMRDGQNRHVALTADGSNVRLYVNGTEVGSITMTGINHSYGGSDRIVVGAYYSNWGSFSTTGYHSGLVCETAVYPSALSSTRIAAHVAEADNVSTQTPVSARSYLNVDTRSTPRARAYLHANTASALSVRAYLRANTTAPIGRAYLRANTLQPVTGRCYLRADTETDFSVALRAGVKWGLRLLIDNVDMTSLLSDVAPFNTDWSIGKSFVASFVLMPQTGTLDPADFEGKTVVLEYKDIATDGSTNYQIQVYRGTLSRADWMAGRGLLYCKATTNSDARFRTMEASAIAREFDGEWSQYVFSDTARGWDHARDRLSTRQDDLWFKVNGGVLFKPWASATADFEWQDDNIIPNSVRWEPPARNQITNHIRVRFDYQYQRLRQRMIRCDWATGVDWCHRMLHPFLLAQRSQIRGAAKGRGGWQIIGDIAFDDVPPAGSYRCFPFGVGTVSKYIVWAGDPGDEDKNPLWAWSAIWVVGRRWAQEITERYEAEVVSQASIDANGLLAQTDDYGVRCEKDSSDWLTAEGYSEAGSGFAALGNNPASNGLGIQLGDQVLDANSDGPGSRADFEQAQRAGFAAAAVEIVEGHRGKLTAASLFDPRVKPGITVRINHLKKRGTGHLVGIRQSFNFKDGRATTTVDTGPFVPRGAGLVSASPLDPIAQPARPAEVDIIERISFPTHIGGLTTSPFLDEDWTGYLTNYQYDPTNQNPFAANPVQIGNRAYPNQFTVEYPEIDQQHLQAIEVQAAQRLEVVVPNDELVLIQ